MISEAVTVVAADVMNGSMMVYFSNGTSYLYSSQTLYAHRAEGEDTTLPDPNILAVQAMVTPKRA